LKICREFGFKQSSNLTFIQILLFQGVHELAHELLSVTHLFGFGTAAARENEGPQAVPDL
jgi:hypothetical protein